MNRIKEVLEEKGIRQTWLAEKLGKSYNTVNAYAARTDRQPRLEDTIRRLQKSWTLTCKRIMSNI